MYRHCERSEAIPLKIASILASIVFWPRFILLDPGLLVYSARGLGIENRLDPAQSISGGARYYADLYKQLPESIKGPDRRWYALAAYNIGMGHIYDARTLARQLKKNPDLWQEISKVLPLLSNKNYYPRLKHGYARGREPVRYVQRIRDYQNISEKTLSSR